MKAHAVVPKSTGAVVAVVIAVTVTLTLGVLPLIIRSASQPSPALKMELAALALLVLFSTAFVILMALEVVPAAVELFVRFNCTRQSPSRRMQTSVHPKALDEKESVEREPELSKEEKEQILALADAILCTERDERRLMRAEARRLLARRRELERTLALQQAELRELKRQAAERREEAAALGQQLADARAAKLARRRQTRAR